MPNEIETPEENEARGFALYFGIDEATAKAAGTSLSEIAANLRQTFAGLVPQAADQTYAAVALAPKGAGGRNIDVVRNALQEPRAKADKFDNGPSGIFVDISRQRVYLNGENAEFTAKEFALLTYLIQNEGQAISRETLVDVITNPNEEPANERTIDVHVRRLRAKIEGFEDIIRTVRGGGYRFDKHPDVAIDDYSI
ncbi:MAG: winged helix-turn-helix domain-containing protein [Micrococcales bacterium]